MNLGFPFSLINNTVTVFVDNKLFTVNANETQFNSILEELRQPSPDKDTLLALLSKKEQVSQAVSTVGGVTVDDYGVLYHGERVEGLLSDRLLEMLDSGFDAKPWANFLENLMLNPSYNSRNSLYEFLEKYSAPITSDGCFIAFKRVGQNFFDLYSGKFDNSPGKFVSMGRELVDDNTNNTCSAGLHVCADEYLASYCNYGDNKTIAVAVNPRDVVAVPADYNSTKMRTCAYTVLCEVEHTNFSDLQGKQYLDDTQIRSWSQTGSFEAPF